MTMSDTAPPSHYSRNYSYFNGSNSSPVSHSNSVEETQSESRRTPYERLFSDLSNDQRVLKEITLGKRIGFYRLRGELGSGNFSQVKMGIHALTKEKVAVKILDKTKLDQKTQRLLSREISSMERLHHPNVIRLYEVVETLAKLHIIMEYAGGGELFTKISSEGRLPEREARALFAQVVAAVTHMHANHIIHRDLKAENVFFATSCLVKVGDFGFSTFSRSDNTLDTFCGSPPYAAPELFKDESYYGIYVDIWALGILLYFMVTGIMPFRAETVAKLKKCILEGSYTIPSYVSDSCKVLIRDILKPTPCDRANLGRIRTSDWLDGEEFPDAFDNFQLNPSSDSGSRTDVEQEAHKELKNLGITDSHLKQAHGKESRSSINGTYRIVLHKIQKHRTREHEYYADEDLNGRWTGGKENREPVGHRKQTKVCVIL